MASATLLVASLGAALASALGLGGVFPKRVGPPWVFLANALPPRGAPIPRNEIIVTGGHPKTDLAFDAKPVCIPLGRPIELAMRFPRTRLVTGLRMRVSAGNTPARARAHGRPRDLFIRTNVGVTRVSLPDGAASSAALQHPVEVQLGWAPAATWQVLESRGIERITVVIANVWPGDSSRDVCLSRFQIIAVDAPVEASERYLP